MWESGWVTGCQYSRDLRFFSKRLGWESKLGGESFYKVRGIICGVSLSVEEREGRNLYSDCHEQMEPGKVKNFVGDSGHG